MKWNEMKRLAVANGFQYVTSRGKHDEMRGIAPFLNDKKYMNSL